MDVAQIIADECDYVYSWMQFRDEGNEICPLMLEIKSRYAINLISEDS